MTELKINQLCADGLLVRIGMPFFLFSFKVNNLVGHFHLVNFASIPADFQIPRLVLLVVQYDDYSVFCWFVLVFVCLGFF